ncbi:hypothetical protein [Micromonospora violae]|uniref:hypothetical protein n=1 Tax=Micromonospora violae TaxID=1278207 RepID=UPI00102CAAE3|nr:hypothetical protein [Micromonospora violae]
MKRRTGGDAVGRNGPPAHQGRNSAARLISARAGYLAAAAAGFASFAVLGLFTPVAPPPDDDGGQRPPGGMLHG